MATVLFEGVKTFWKTKNAVHVIIVEHSEDRILEVVAYDEAIGAEAPRVYIDKARIIRFLGQPASGTTFCESELAASMASFVFNRLYISAYLPVSRAMVVTVERGFSAMEQEGDFDVVIDRPPNLVPYSRLKSPSSSVVSLSMKERWRLPLILIRLTKGLPLRSNGATIYAKFSAGKSQLELMEAVRRTLGVTTTPAQAKRFSKLAHSIVSKPPSRLPIPGAGVPRHTQPVCSTVSPEVGASSTVRRFSPPSSPSLPEADVPVSLSTASGHAIASPDIAGGSHGKSARQQIRDILRRPGAFLHSLSAPTSAAPSAEHSPVGSRPSSPRRLRAARNASPQVSPLMPAESVGGDDEWEELPARLSKPALYNSPTVPAASRRVGHSPGSPGDGLTRAPPRHRAGSKSPVMCLADDQDLLGTTLSDSVVGVYASPLDAHGGVGVGVGVGSRLKALRQRCLSFDIGSDWLTSPAMSVPDPTDPSSEGQPTGGWANSGQQLVRHLRSGSGEAFSALLGLSTSTSRVVPGGSETESSVEGI